MTPTYISIHEINLKDNVYKINNLTSFQFFMLKHIKNAIKKNPF
jgi:hypothetical protein